MPSALEIHVYEVDDAGDALVVSLAGEADIDTAPILRCCLLRLLNRWQSPIILDLSHLEFIDSTGVSALVAGYHRAKQFDCVLCAVALTSCVAKVFDVTALDTIIPTYQGVAEACEKQLQLNQTPVQHAPVPIETFLMRRVPADAETPVDSTMNA